VELTLAEGEPQEIAPRLRAGELDLALLFEFDEPSLEQGMTRIELLEDPMYLALGREHPLARKAKLRLEDLSEQAWVQTSQESPCARHVVRCCHQTVQGLVAAGVGVALIPELALSSVREDIAIRALAPRPPARRVIAAAPAGARLLPAAPAMLVILEQVAAGYEGLGARLAA
jgi:DNA-binding transcriptional LysR family regulator